MYSNDHPEDVHTDVIMMALQSNGSINLRGILTDQQYGAPGGCGGDGCHTAAIDDAKRRQWIEAARASGFRNIPSSVSGEAAVQLILAEARAASSSNPLVIIAGGPLMRIAEAYRRDPSIASKLIVSLAGFADYDGDGKYYGETNITGDQGASQTVLENLRCVIVPFIDFNARGIDQTRYPSTPRWRVEQLPGDPLRALMLNIYAYPWAHYDADGGPTATLLSSSYATASKRVRWARDSGGPYLADDASTDDVLITQVNGGSTTEAWWSEVTRAFAR
ncbi:MAG TPA: nucleoside hydrolase [Polyangiales bacterium]|nr:nucleoside hydrolase [Polyangiales bacterium]